VAGRSLRRTALFTVVQTLLFITSIPLHCLGGEISTQGIYYPNSNRICELRTTVTVNEYFDLTPWLSIGLGGGLRGLLSTREFAPSAEDFIVDENYIHIHFNSLSAKLGYLRETWGKLDQISPLDILNPIEVSSAFLDCEKEQAKIPIPMSVFSVYFSDTLTFKLSLIPFFEKSVYDDLEEDSSPYNVVEFPLPLEEQVPEKAIGNVEFGTGVFLTLRETDCALYYFRGFQDFPAYRIENILPPTKIFAQYPLIHMLGLDFETVVDRWGIRGECSLLFGEGYQRTSEINYIEANALTSGIGLDTSYADNYFNASVLYRTIFVTESIEEEKNEISITANFEKRIAYDTVEVDFLGMYNVFSGSIYGKATLSVSPIDNFWISSAISVFEGESGDYLGRFRDKDAYYLELVYNF